MSFQFELDPRDEASATLVAEVGKKLQRHCVLKGFSQNELAEKLGVNRSHISRSLSGFNNLTLKTLAELAWAMDCRVTLELQDAPTVSVVNEVIASPSNIIVFNSSSPHGQTDTDNQQQSANIELYGQAYG